MAIFGWPGGEHRQRGGQLANDKDAMRSPGFLSAFWDALSGGSNKVTKSSAMRVTTALACGRLIAESVGALPFPYYERVENGERKKAVDAPLHELLTRRPNSRMTPVEFWSWATLGLVFEGNAFSEIVRSGSKIVSLEPLPPSTAVELKDGRYRYKVPVEGDRIRVLDENDVLHIRGFGSDGLRGLSAVAAGAEALGMALASDQLASKLMKNGLRPSGFITAEKVITDPAQRKQFRENVLEPFAEGQNVSLLEGGFDFKPITLKPEEAQFLEARRFGVEEICRLFGVPPHMVGHTQNSTSWGSGLEQQVLGFQKFTLQPYIARIEQAVNRALVPDAERRTHYAEFNVDALLRGDSAARAAHYGAMFNLGAMTPARIAQAENLPPVPGGDRHFLQAGFVPLANIDQETTE